MTEVANVNDPLLVIVSASPSLFNKTSVPESPETVPPMEYVDAGAAGAGAEYVGTAEVRPPPRVIGPQVAPFHETARPEGVAESGVEFIAAAVLGPKTPSAVSPLDA